MEKSIRGEARIQSVPVGEHPVRQHSLQIANREQITVDGVVAVDSFDDEEIMLETEMGTLTLKGEELHIKQLDLETGRFAAEGFLHSCLYSMPRGRGNRSAKGRSLLERLLK